MAKNKEPVSAAAHVDVAVKEQAERSGAYVP